MWLMGAGDGVHIDASVFTDISLQLLLPFVAGQLLRTWVLPVIRRIKRIALFDKTVIVLVVYAAFSDGVADGIWSTIGAAELAWLLFCTARIGWASRAPGRATPSSSRPSATPRPTTRR